MTLDWKTATAGPTYPNLEDWIVGEAKGGRKFEQVMFAVADTMVALIRWTDGTRQWVCVGTDEQGLVRVLAKAVPEE